MHIGDKILNKDRCTDRVQTAVLTEYRQKIRRILVWSVCCILYSVLLTSCRTDEVVYPTIGTHVTDEVRTGGLYVLCEGNMGANKARLDYMNLETGEYYSNWYGSQNPNQIKELGDVGNDVQVYGGKLYAVINCSHKLEVTDRKARHIAQIDIPNCRYLAFAKGKAYVSAYVGSVADPDMLGSVFEIDTASLEITREVKVGHQPDELCIHDGRLYVVNSGGYLINRHDSTMSVIDLDSFTELRQIPVGENPQRVRADNSGQLWVSTDDGLVVMYGERIIQRIPLQVQNLSILGSTVYVLERETNELLTVSTVDYQISNLTCQMSNQWEHPYGLLAAEDALYITDAKNYVSSGVLHCYSYDGRERWTAKTGDIPGHLCRVTEAYTLYGDTTQIINHKSKFINRVYEYIPAPGQFVNELPKYEEGDDAASMCRKCEQAIANNAGGLVCLGGWGGYITFGFDHAVLNQEGYDLQILGNAFTMPGNMEYGSSEPGIVLVSRDDNRNGVPDDAWYELKGSLYDDPATQHDYTRTYTRAGDTLHNTFHQHPYYPQWIERDEMTFRGALLPSQSQTVSGQNVQRLLAYGYTDNKPNTDKEGTSFDLSWAVDGNGQLVLLDSVHFVRVYTAVDEVLELTGELSTEINGAVDLHVQ